MTICCFKDICTMAMGEVRVLIAPKVLGSKGMAKGQAGGIICQVLHRRALAREPPVQRQLSEERQPRDGRDDTT